MKIILTGGSGLLGTTILETLSSEFPDTWHLSRTQNSKLPAKNWMHADFRNVRESMAQIESIGKTDVLIHNAAAINNGTTLQEYTDIISCNLAFTSELWKWAEKNVSQCIIFNSSLSFLQRPIPQKITEESQISASTIYSFSKLSGEKMLELLPTTARKVIFRISSPVSTDFKLMPETVVKKMIHSARDKKVINVFGLGQRKQDFVAVTDIANAIRKSIDAPSANGIYNMSSGSMLSMKELASLIAKKFNAEITYTGVDSLEQEAWNIDITKAFKDIGYEPAYSSRSIIEKLLSDL